MLKTHKGWVCLCDLGVDAVFSPWGGALPGVARRLLTFLASPRKVSKRRRPQESSPAARVPKSSDSQPASQTNSLRSNMFAPLNPSDHHLPWQRQMRVRQKQQPCHFTSVRNYVQTQRLCLVSHCADAVCAGQKMEKEVGVSERSVAK